MAEMNELLAEFLKAEEDHGFGVGGGTLPIGVYPVLIEKVPRVDGGRRKTENGVELLGTPNARLQLRVLDGPFADRVAFVNMNLVNPFDPHRKGSQFYNMSATFIRDIGAPIQPVNPALFESPEEAAKAAYAPEKWEGLKFVAEIGLETVEKQKSKAQKRNVELDESKMQDRNTLAGWHAWGNEKSGYEAWKKNELPKQVAKAGKGAGVQGLQQAAVPGAVKF